MNVCFYDCYAVHLGFFLFLAYASICPQLTNRYNLWFIVHIKLIVPLRMGPFLCSDSALCVYVCVKVIFLLVISTSVCLMATTSRQYFLIF
uniref:Uncharacterized protein n=1 Tax=Amblyomma triste TaxID=251400 RepID=A0A023G1J9_AMBTT